MSSTAHHYGPQFTATREESRIITKIAQRAIAIATTEGIDYDYQSAHMDIEACHSNGMPLDLTKLLNAPDGDFGHDVFGIRRFMDRDTGRLLDCFVPRCAMPQS